MDQSFAQSTDCVLMVRPACFYPNPETALTNEFQDVSAVDFDRLDRAWAEFDAAVRTLRDEGINVIVVEDRSEPQTPDAIFPNNWLTTHADGTCVMYPMQPHSRRGERRIDIVEELSSAHGKTVRRILDWSGFEREGLHLEGTGSLVLDHTARVAYACASARTHEAVVEHFCHQFDYTPVLFHAVSETGQAIYHTNVMMCVGTGFAVVCLDSIEDEFERTHVQEALARGHEIVAISLHQVARFAGNMLELRSASGGRILVMSSSAFDSLSDAQRSVLSRHAKLVQCDVSTIESASGGSIRCMLAEIFLP